MTYVTPAIADITGLQTALDGLASDISDEAARALAAEGVIAGDLAAEVVRATGAESALSGRIDALEGAAVVEFAADEFTGEDDFVLANVPVAASVVASVNGLIVKPSLVTVDFDDNTATVTFGGQG